MFGNLTIPEIICAVLILLYSIFIFADIRASKKKRKPIYKIDFIFSIAMLVFMVGYVYIIGPSVVIGPSMDPTLHHKQVLLLNKAANNFDRFEIVVFRADNLDKTLIKRVIAKEGETVEIRNGDLFINGRYIEETFEKYGMIESMPKVTVPEKCYFVMGDNRPASLDSRSEKVGFVNKKYIRGKILLQG